MNDSDESLESLEARLDALAARIDQLACRDTFERALAARLGFPPPPLHVRRRRPWRPGKLRERAGKVFRRLDFRVPRGLFYLHQYSPRPLTEKAPVRWTTYDHAPRIALVTPSFNQAPFVGSTVESVLSQNYPDLAYVVQDGGSKDRTTEVLAGFGAKLQWTSAPDGGQTAAINAGFAKVEGDVMAYLNSDDILLPGSLAAVAHAFERYPEVDVIYSHRIIIDGAGDEIGRWVLPRHDPDVIRWADYIPQETMFWRRRVWDAVGPFDESFRYAMDWDFILRAHRAGFRFKRLPLFLGCFRVHEAQKTTAINDVGAMESARLRQTHLGFAPTQAEVEKAIAGYVGRHRVVNRLHHTARKVRPSLTKTTAATTLPTSPIV